jgi:hypothetical protein
MKPPVSTPGLVTRFVREPDGRAQRRVQGRLARIGQWEIDVGALLDQELAQAPVPVKCRAIEVQVVAQRLQGFAVGQQESHRTHVAVVRAPPDQRRTSAVGQCRRVPLRDKVEDQVGASGRDPVQERGSHGSNPPW